MSVTTFRRFQVVEVPEGSPGEGAGIRVGDIIEEYDGKRIDCDINQFVAILQRAAGRSDVSLILWRDGQAIHMRVPGGNLGMRLIEASAASSAGVSQGQAMEPKSSGVAIILSFFWTGLGQLYAGEIGRGIAMAIATPIIWAFAWGTGLFGAFTGCLVGGTGALDSFASSLSHTRSVYSGSQVGAVAGGLGMVGLIALALAVCWWVWGMVDAKRRCQLHNMRVAILSPAGGLVAVGVATPAKPTTASGQEASVVGALPSDLRPCPYCAEMIKKEAIRCRFCHADIEAVGEDAVKAEREKRAAAEAAREAGEKVAVEAAERARKQDESTAMEVARQMWAAGDRAGAKELLLPLLTRPGSPPSQVTAQDYVKLALLEAEDSGAAAALQILSRIPIDLTLEATPEALEAATLLGREAILKVNDEMLERVQGFAVRSHLRDGSVMAALRAILEVRSAIDFLDRGSALDTVDAVIGSAREVLKGVTPDDPTRPSVEARIRLVEERVAKMRARKKRMIVNAAVAAGAVVVASVVLGVVSGRTSGPRSPLGKPSIESGSHAVSPKPVQPLLHPVAQPHAEENLPAATVQPPCARARAPEAGEPLTVAIKLSYKKAAKAADASYYQQAAAKAEEATAIDPQCADAWSMLAYVRYRMSYDICGRGDYSSAEVAAQKALSLGPEPKIRAAIMRNRARIAAAQLKWAEAERLLNDSLSLDPTSHDARSWLDDLSVLTNPRPEFVAEVNKVLAGQAVIESDINTFSAGELTNLANAVLARYGRRMNAGPADWFFFCDGSPVRNHPMVDLNATRNPIKKGTPDSENEKLISSARRQVKEGSAPVVSAPSRAEIKEPTGGPTVVENEATKVRAQVPAEKTAAGIWVGEGRQTNGSSWSIRLTLLPESAPGKRGADIEYPSLGCGGTLVRQATASLAFQEILDHGLGKCIDRGFVTLTYNSRVDSLQFEYRNGPGADASAVLRRARQ
jgi:tetratricopeptide (TPR) repeat protein/TM2 domain-containing membrane protein YozV